MQTRMMVSRLSVYRRLLAQLLAEGRNGVFSHELAALAGVSAAQVRRDLMAVDYSGSPQRGYDVATLMERIAAFLDAPGGQVMVLVGLGHVGQALLAYFAGRRQALSIVAAFDRDPHKVDRVIHGCRCYPITMLEEVTAEHRASVGIIAVPGSAAEEVAGRLVRAGARALVNFAPVRLHMPEHVYVDDVDITVAIERAAYFARHAPSRKEGGR